MNLIPGLLAATALMGGLVVFGTPADNPPSVPIPVENPVPTSPNPNPNLNLNPNPNPTAEASGTNLNQAASVIIVVGAAGEEQFGQVFRKSADLWIQAAAKGGAKTTVIGLDRTNAVPDLERLHQALTNEPIVSSNELWLVLLGHGTFNGQEAKFNLRGPDLSVTNLVLWLRPFQRPLAIVDGTSASAPFLPQLSAPGRVVITATRSGYEQNYARLGQYLASAIADPQADLDKDGQTSLLEAFLLAARRVTEFYETGGRLATEHALIDDNGDGLGTPADWFRGIHAIKQAREGASLDGLRANQIHLVRSIQEQQLAPEVRARRDELELAVAKLRESKSKLSADEYYRQLEPLMVEIAKLSGP